MKFLYFSVAAPSKTNDNQAFWQCLGLTDWLEALPDKYFISADNSYTLLPKSSSTLWRQRERKVSAGI